MISTWLFFFPNLRLNVTAYGFTQHASGAKVMFELMKVQCPPASLDDLPSLCMQLNKPRMLQEFNGHYCMILYLRATIIVKEKLPVHVNIALDRILDPHQPKHVKPSIDF